MEYKDDYGSGQPEGRLVRVSAGRGTPVYTDSGKRLGRVEWFVIDPVAGGIALVMIGARRWGLFGRGQVAVPWAAIAIDERNGSLVVRTEDGLNGGKVGGRLTPAVRRDPARID